MATFTINGQGSPASTGGFTLDAGNIYTDVVDIVPGRATANGQHPIQITRMGVWASGRGSTLTCSLQVGSGGTNQFNMAAAGSAQSTGQRDLNYAAAFFADGGTTQASITIYGPAYYGRSTVGGRNVLHTTQGLLNANSTLAGNFDYAQAPTEPQTPAAVSGTGSAALSWAAPSTDGESAITAYRIEYSTDPTFTTGVASKSVGNVLSDTVTGLTPGQTYYFRIAARNAVTDNFGTWSLYSSTVSATTGAAPSAPQTPAVAMGAGRGSVSWTAPANTNGAPVIDYTVDYGTDPAFGAFTSVTTTALAKTITGLTPGTLYYFRVKARNSIGTSVASSTVSGTVPARTALDTIEAASLHVSGGVQVEVRSDGANTPTLTLGYVAFGTGTAFVAIAVLPTGSGAGQFAVPGGPRNVALVADAAGNLFVIGTDGANPNAVLVKRYARTATTTWAASGSLSQALPSTGDALVQYAAAYVPGTGLSQVPSILVLARRAGTVGLGALSYATVSTAAVAASSGDLFVAYGTDPTWLATPPTGQTPDTGALDVAVMTGTTLALAANGYAIVTVTNGVVAGVAKAANGTSLTGKVRVIGISGSAFAVLNVVGAALTWTFYGSNGAVLGSGSYAAANAQGGAFAAQWDAFYDRVAQVVTAYYVADDASNKLESIDISPTTYAASAAVVLSAAFGAGASANTPLRVPAGIVDERRVLVDAANLAAGVKSTVAYSDRSGNSAPNAPSQTDVVGYDATVAQLFAWGFGDPNPADVQTAYEFQVQRVSDSVDIVATGKVASAASDRSVAGAVLTNGVNYRWRVRTWDELDTQGAWSAYDAFATAALGTLTITNPAADNPAGLEVSSLNITWSYVQANGYVQTQRRVRVIRVSDSAVLSDTTMQASAVANYTVTGLPSDVPVRVEVSIVTNAPGTPTVTANRLLTTSYAAPMTPAASLSTTASYIEIDVTNPAPTGSRPEVITNLIERRPTGSGEDFVPVARVGHNGTYHDHAVRSGQQYDYRVRGITA